jgi:hypothetical protein
MPIIYTSSHVNSGNANGPYLSFGFLLNHQLRCLCMGFPHHALPEKLVYSRMKATLLRSLSAARHLSCAYGSLWASRALCCFKRKKICERGVKICECGPNACNGQLQADHARVCTLTQEASLNGCSNGSAREKRRMIDKGFSSGSNEHFSANVSPHLDLLLLVSPKNLVHFCLLAPDTML